MNVYSHSNEFGQRLKNLTVSVINRSEIVGRPLAAMLANDGATVYSVDIKSIEKYSRSGNNIVGMHEVSLNNIQFISWIIFIKKRRQAYYYLLILTDN